MKLNVGNEYILFQDSKSGLPDRYLGKKCTVKRVENQDVYLVQFNESKYWYVNFEDLRKLTKLELALK